jgi:hypothetical protein
MISEEASLRAVIDSCSGRSLSHDAAAELTNGVSALTSSVRTEFSATVFSGEARDWVQYLSTPLTARYEPGVGVRAHLHHDLRRVVFEPENEDSRWLAELLDQVLSWVRQRAERKPNVLALLDELLFANPADAGSPPRIVLSPGVPSTGTREAEREQGPRSVETRFVFQSRMMRDVRDVLQAAEELSADEKLGLAWPVASRLLSQIAYPLSARDRFVAKIDACAKLAYLAINVLYEEYSSGQLVPNGAGVAFEVLTGESCKLARARLFERHPYFRTLNKLSFLLRARPYATYADEARIVAREYLDTVYIRLSLASAMPELAVTTRPMPIQKRWGRITTPKPQVGHYGIVDEEDQAAWQKLAKPFREIGFILLRQIGVGDFGRVYEAMNEKNPQFPERLALKVDRIAGGQKQAILEAEAAMRVGGQLARAPHLVRLYDTGKLQGRRFTYHVLQLIDGDTLDNLIQVAGAEHATTGGPPNSRTSERQAREEYERAVAGASPQQREWRRRRMGLPFKYPLSAAMVLDVLTSVLLTVEEVHRLGYSINDLKNDNLMMSRRGQIKGIDLDSFTPIQTPFDKVTDFMFLAASVILLMFNAPSARPCAGLDWKELAESEARLRGEFAHGWPLGDIEALSQGRVSKHELIELLVDLVQRCHQLTYTRRPDLFSADIARLIELKRRLLTEEFVID